MYRTNLTHTNGPWHVDKPIDQGCTHMIGAWIPGKDSRYLIAQTHPITDDPETSYGSDGNASLIAAAPELLAVCRAFLRAPSIGSSGPGSVSIEVTTFNLDAARAAVAKAEGRP